MKLVYTVVIANGLQCLEAPPGHGYTRQDGSPSQPGDVLSVQPGGVVQTRDPAKAAEWETVSLNGAIATFAVEGKKYIYVPE